MKTNYQIQSAHSGTSISEVRKAKRLYNKGVKKGKYCQADKVGIVFSDHNCVIQVRYIDLDTMITMGTERITN
jgi:hypothetical protein